MGATSNIRMAKEVLFWPGMNKDIKDMCNACEECAKYKKSSPKEPMKSLPIPSLPWQIISQDLFAWNNNDYLVTDCHFSDWIEVDQLPNTLSTTVINCSKAHFARHCIPDICHTDNGPQFISNDFITFAKTYGFKHTRSAPYYPKGNLTDRQTYHNTNSSKPRHHQGAHHTETHYSQGNIRSYRRTNPCETRDWNVCLRQTASTEKRPTMDLWTNI